jgi:hypothetical protein
MKRISLLLGLISILMLGMLVIGCGGNSNSIPSQPVQNEHTVGQQPVDDGTAATDDTGTVPGEDDTVASGPLPGPINAKIDPSVGTVKGSVEDERHHGLPNIPVSCDGIPMTVTGKNGYYTITGLQPGQHTISASSAEYFNAGDGQQTKVVIGGKSTTIPDLHLIAVSIDKDSKRFVYLWHLNDQLKFSVAKKAVYLRSVLYSDSLVGTFWPKHTEMMSYILGFRYARFRATIGVDDSDSAEKQKNAKLVFRIYINQHRTPVYTSPVVSKGRPVKVDIPIDNVNTLDLKVEYMPSAKGVIHYAWGDARLVLK